MPQLRAAIDSGEKLVIDLDGTAGYATSFLEESFGGLIREEGFSCAEVIGVLRFLSAEEPQLIEEIMDYMRTAQPNPSRKGRTMTFVLTQMLDSRPARYCLGCIFGILLGVILTIRESIRIDPTLTASALIQALATIGAGLTVALIIQRLLQNDQREKDFLMKRLEKLAELAEELKKQSQEQTFTDEVATLKKMNMIAIGLLEVVRTLSRHSFPERTFDFVEDVKELRELATNTPIGGIMDHAENSECTAEIREGIRKLAEDRWQRLVGLANALGGRVLTAQICVMRA